MQQLNTYRFYELGAKLHGLSCSGTACRTSDMFAPLTEAQALLDSFIKGDVFALESSKTDATRLLNKISDVFSRYYIDAATKQLKAPTGEDRIDTHELSLIHTLIEKFEHALAAELNHAPTYAAGKHGIYATHDLAENARQVFSATLCAVIPATVLREIDAAGRALAFDFGTATVVHLVRAVDLMLKLYFEGFADPATLTKGERNYTNYLKKLAALAEEEDKDKTQRPDRRVIQMLTHIKDHYRNPLITPDISISVDEAMQIFSMANALIALMAEQIATRKSAERKTSGKNSPLPSAKALLDDEEEPTMDFQLSQAG